MILALKKKIKNWTIKNKLDLVGFNPRGVNCILLKNNNNNKIRKKDAITRSLPLWKVQTFNIFS